MSKTKPLDQMSSTSAYSLDHTAKIQNKIEPHSNILKRLMEFASSVPDFRRLAKGNIRHRLSDIILLILLGRPSKFYDELDMIADKEKWGGNMTVVEYESEMVRKSTGARTTERRLYVTSLPTDTPLLGAIVRSHWSIESMHWGLDCNLQQDRIRRKSAKSARNLDTIQRTVYSVFSIWKRLRKKRADRRKGMAELMRYVSASFTKLIHFLLQK